MDRVVGRPAEPRARPRRSWRAALGRVSWEVGPGATRGGPRWSRAIAGGCGPRARGRAAPPSGRPHSRPGLRRRRRPFGCRPLGSTGHRGRCCCAHRCFEWRVVGITHERPARSGLVCRTMLSRVRVLARVDDPVLARRRAVPRGATPGRVVGVPCLVVRRRAHGRLAHVPAPCAAGAARCPRPGARRARRAGRRTRPGTRAGGAGTRSIRAGPGRSRPLARLAGPRGIGAPGFRWGRRGRPRCSRTAGGDAPSRQPIVCLVDREESGQRRLAGGIGMERLGEEAIGALDLCPRGAGLEAQRPVGIAIRVRFVRHGASVSRSGLERRWAGG